LSNLVFLDIFGIDTCTAFKPHLFSNSGIASDKPLLWLRVLVLSLFPAFGNKVETAIAVVHWLWEIKSALARVDAIDYKNSISSLFKK
jgi:hypothetical protein